MNDFQVVIDAGHGGDDPGAVANNVKEKDLNLQISRYMYDKFKEKGIPVTLIRSDDETLSPSSRVEKILSAYGNNPNVVVISNHINSNETGTAEGAEVIYALRNNDKLAKNVLEAIGNQGQIMRSYYQRRLPSDTSKDYYFIHRDTGKTEPIIIEYGFINNANDLARIQNNYKKYVDAVVNAVIATKLGINIPSTPESGTFYVVKSGDSLYSIASRYGTTVDAIKKLNNLTSNNLTIGQVLQLPSEEIVPGVQTYVVKSGDSLYSIASKYGTTVDALKKINNLTSDNLTIGQILKVVEPENVPLPGNTYIVKSGDSLWSIANKNGTTADELKKLNNLTNNMLSVGQILRLPSPSGNGNTQNTYIVKSGDSLYSIASKNGTTVDELKKLNNLTSNNLTIGQVLKLPTASNDNITYIVKSGDSLYNIASRYGTTVDEIKRLNNLISNNLSIGQVLRIPR